MKKFRQNRTIKRNVLIVDDELINREILGNILSQEYTVSYADNAKEALEKLAKKDSSYSLVLLDLLMPVMDGFQFLQKRSEDEALKRIPVIVMTSEKESEVRSLKLGAEDFIKKPFDMPEVVLARCERIIELFEDQSLIKQTERDSVTGLYTHDYFFEYIRQIERWDADTSRDVLVIDIERFHLVNEFCGRPFGDLLLSKIAETLERELPAMNAMACRANADTFYVYAAHQDDYEDLHVAILNVLNDFKMNNNPRALRPLGKRIQGRRSRSLV